MKAFDKMNFENDMSQFLFSKFNPGDYAKNGSANTEEQTAYAEELSRLAGSMNQMARELIEAVAIFKT